MVSFSQNAYWWLNSQWNKLSLDLGSIPQINQSLCWVNIRISLMKSFFQRGTEWKHSDSHSTLEEAIMTGHGC